MTIELNKHQITTTDNITLAAYTAGNPDHPALVFVHGYPDNHSIWQPVMAHFVEDYFIVTYDVRGAGQSDAPQDVSAYKLAQLSDDLYAVTQQLLGDKPFHVVGHDWGSTQTWESACQERFKGKMRSFTSISGACLDHVGYLYYDKTVSTADKFRQFLRGLYVYWFHVPLLPKLLWRLGAKNWHIQHKLPYNPDLYEQAITGMNLYKANIIKKQSDLREIHAICPVQLLLFTNDQYVTPFLYSQAEHWVRDLTRNELPLKHWDVYHGADSVAEWLRGYLRQYQYEVIS